MTFTVEKIENGWLLSSVTEGFGSENRFCATLEAAAAEMVRRGTVKRFVADESEALA